MLSEKNLTSLSLFSSGSSISLVVVPLPKNFIRPPKLKSKQLCEEKNTMKFFIKLNHYLP